MTAVTFPPFAIFPEYVKGGGKGGSGDDDGEVPSGDVTLVVSVVEEFEENNCIDHYAHYDKDFTSNIKSTVSTSEIIERTSSEEDTLQKYLMWQINLLNIILFLPSDSQAQRSLLCTMHNRSKC